MDVLRKRRPDGRRATGVRCPIRPARLADVGDVDAIERAVFSDPWSANDFTECVTSGVPFLVAERRGVVAGYIIAHSAADEGEILNLGVAAAHRRQGIGRALVERVLQELAGRGVRTVYLEVRASNAAARQLYESLGFGEVARRSGYYRRPVEDAVVLRAAIPAEGGSAKL
ncbi:MAG TPA: ribosomal protein S18-alanine N-acetyltransferase [Gemmatimonadales bacterium]|nr:ribosomal protein S18-alanine N-acetyltransferase [Gemmatimonadales bacterium]